MFSLGVEHIQHIQLFPRKKHILGKESQLDSTYSTFPQKQAHFPLYVPLKKPQYSTFQQKGGHFGKNVPLSAEMLNVVGMR